MSGGGYEWPVAATVIAGLTAVTAAVLRYVRPRAGAAAKYGRCNVSPEEIPGLAKYCRKHDERMSQFDKALAIMQEKNDHIIETLDETRKTVTETRRKIDNLDSWIRRNLIANNGSER